MFFKVFLSNMSSPSNWHLAGSACPSNGPSMVHCQQGGMASFMGEEQILFYEGAQKKHTNEEEYWEEVVGFWEDSVF